MDNKRNAPQLFLLNSITSETVDIIEDDFAINSSDIVAYEDLSPNRDIIIFNTKLTITLDWIGKLQQTLYSYDNIGTVSPLNETDLIFQDGEIENLSNLSLECISDMLPACSPKDFPDTDQNNFECIIIRKELLQDIGIPEKETMCELQKAYKWFSKASQFGWIHKVCTTAMVRNSSLTNTCNTAFTYYGTHLLKELANNIQLYMKLSLDNGRKSILHYLLADFQEGMQNNVGGTQFHVADLVECQRYSYNVFVLARDGEYLRLSEYVDDRQIRFDFWAGAVPDHIRFSDKRYNDICQTVLKCFGIDLVHVHHTLWMTLDIFNLASKLEIPVVFSVHDFYFVCPILKMINPEGKLCDKNSCGHDCNLCLMENKSIADGQKYLDKCQREYQKVLRFCHKIIFPSGNALETVTPYFEDIMPKSVIIEHGIRLPENTTPVFEHSVKRIAFIGGISDIKGGPVIYDLITRNQSKYEWYLMGGIGYLPLYHLKQTNLHKTGWYKRYEIYNLLQEYEIDIVCILSTVAETFCYTLSEAIAAGIPVIATDVGALGSRMKQMNCGWIVPRNATASEIECILDEISKNPDLYKEMKKKVSAAKVKDLSQMKQDYADLYQDCMRERRKRASQETGKIIPFLHTDSTKEPETEETHCTMPAENACIEGLEQEVIGLRAKLYELENSPIIRLALKIRRISFPGKNALKNIIKRHGRMVH